MRRVDAAHRFSHAWQDGQERLQEVGVRSRTDFISGFGVHFKFIRKSDAAGICQRNVTTTDVEETFFFDSMTMPILINY